MEHPELAPAENFQRYFRVSLAVRPEDKDKVYKIRYRVYCAELAYEPADRFPDKMEFDEFDARSLHCLITHRATGLPAGCVRLVSTMDNGTRFLLPMERFCHESIDSKSREKMTRERLQICEISRLAVDGTFRRRNGEWRNKLGLRGATDVSHQEERAFSIIAISGVLAGTALAEITGRGNIYAMMEPYLPRLLRRSGLYFSRAGKLVDYHGLRAPFHIHIDSILANIHADLRALYDAIYAQIEQDYQPDLITKPGSR